MRQAGPGLRLTRGVLLVLLLFLANLSPLRADSTNASVAAANLETTPEKALGQRAGFGVPALAGLGAKPAEAGTPNRDSQPVVESVPPELLRAYLLLQEQLQTTQLALERNRQEAEATAARNAELFQTRLRLLEQALVGERARELDALQDSQRLLLIFAGVFAGAGLLTILLTNYIQWRAVNRLVAMSSAPALPALASSPPLAALGSGAGPIAATGVSETANARWLGIIERLEERVRELEQTARPPVSAPAETPSTAPQSAEEVAADSQALAATRRAAQIDLLMGKGQALLDLGRADEALSCFDETLKLDPQHMEALVKKGDALEQARKPDEAIACYDRAIAADRSFTVAYLHKGGLFNRLDRHAEALQCYEEALKTQEATNGG